MACIALGFEISIYWSAYVTDSEVAQVQPIPFSHKHHVGQLGLDCRYCHTSVEKAATAGIPSTHTCMTCHSQIWTKSPVLAPLREAFVAQKPIHWNRVYRLPNYVYFNHSIHVGKGIGCVSCHGPMDQMPITWQHRAFYMRQCVECHRHPEDELRPISEVFNLHWTAPTNEKERRHLGVVLVERYKIPKQRLTDCTTCHR
jgi:hypothetical protein